MNFNIEPYSSVMKNSANRKYQYCAHILFFGSFYFINNPFLYLNSTVKFSIYLALVILAAIVAITIGVRRLESGVAGVSMLTLLYIFSAIRFNLAESERQADSEFLPILQAATTIIVMLCSFIFLKILDYRLSILAIFWCSAPCTVWIFLNFGALTDYEQKDSFILGNLSYDTYQATAMMVGLGALCGLGYANFESKFSTKNIIPIFSVVTAGYLLANGLARGEAVAFFVASGFCIFPRLFMILSPLFYGVFELAVLTYDTPLTQRLRGIFEGDYGLRDETAWKVYQMVSDEPFLVWFGGGINYFQKYWSLPIGLHPHNFLTEALVTGGMFMFLLFLWGFLYPLFHGFRKIVFHRASWQKRIVYAIVLFQVICFLKSGTIVLGWGLMMVLCLSLSLLSSHHGIVERNNLLGRGKTFPA